MLDPKFVIPDAKASAEALGKETDALVAASKKLVAEMDELLEGTRQLKAAHDALLAASRETREQVKEEQKKKP